jgi:hypothetical protein
VSGGPPRVPFRADFPDVVIQRPFNPLAQPTQHPDYAAAKAGDKDAADRFVISIIAPEGLDRIRRLVGDRRPILVAPHAEETTGRNAIP